MAFNDEPTIARQAPGADHEPMVQDEAAIEVSTGGPDLGAAGPQFNPWRQDIIKLLNDSLATELVCVLRYKRHYFTTDGLVAPQIAKEFLGYANEESAHADRLARRIVELGGEPDFSPDSLTRRSYVAYDDSSDLQGMIIANLIAERTVVESYGKIIKLIGDKDSATRHLVQDILTDEQEHAQELKEWLAD
jgi:bacterioferritin